MKKVLFIAKVGVRILVVIFIVYVLCVNFLARHDAKVAQATLINLVTAVFNEINAKGQVVISLRDKDGKDNTLTLIRKQEAIALTEQDVAAESGKEQINKKSK